MSSSDPLDDLLSQYDVNLLRNLKKTMEVLREAYTIGVPGMIAKSMTDRLGEASGVSFNLGTPVPVIRRIASWLLTVADGNHDVMMSLCTKVWRRHGREDLRLVGILISNMDPDIHRGDIWHTISGFMQRSEPLEALVEVVEEAARAGNAPPSEDWLMECSESGTIRLHLAAVIICVLHIKGELEISDIHSSILGRSSGVSELLDRMISRCLPDSTS